MCAVVGVLLLRGLAEVLDMLEELAARPEDCREGLFTPLVKTLGIALVSPAGRRDMPGRGPGGHGGGAGYGRGLRGGAGVPAAGPGGMGAVEDTGMRKSMVILLLAWWLVAPAWGAELPREVRDALPATAEEITEELEDPASLSEGLSRLWDRALGYVEEAVRQSIGGGVVLLAAAVLCALTEECMAAAGGKVHFVPMAGALAITLAAAGSVKTMMGLGQETVEELNTFSKALLPTLSAAVAASGGIVSASVRQVATIFFVDLLLSLIRGLLLPLVYFYVAAAAADAMLPGRRLAGISRAIRKGTVWLLTGGAGPVHPVSDGIRGGGRLRRHRDGPIGPQRRGGAAGGGQHPGRRGGQRSGRGRGGEKYRGRGGTAGGAGGVPAAAGAAGGAISGV